jgi:hypothetical protein
MPQFQCGDIWSVYEQADLFLITTNATLKGNGALVMGRGLARQARDRFPGLDLALGQAIAARCGHLGRYQLLVSPHWPRAKLGAFQVKRHYRPSGRSRPHPGERGGAVRLVRGPSRGPSRLKLPRHWERPSRPRRRLAPHCPTAGPGHHLGISAERSAGSCAPGRGPGRSCPTPPLST